MTRTDSAEPGPIPHLTTGNGHRPIKDAAPKGDSHDCGPGLLVAFQLRGRSRGSTNRRSGRPRWVLSRIWIVVGSRRSAPLARDGPDGDRKRRRPAERAREIEPRLRVRGHPRDGSRRLPPSCRNPSVRVRPAHFRAGDDRRRPLASVPAGSGLLALDRVHAPRARKGAGERHRVQHRAGGVLRGSGGRRCPLGGPRHCIMGRRSGRRGDLRALAVQGASDNSRRHQRAQGQMAHEQVARRQLRVGLGRIPGERPSRRVHSRSGRARSAPCGADPRSRAGPGAHPGRGEHRPPRGVSGTSSTAAGWASGGCRSSSRQPACSASDSSVPR